MTSKSGKAKGRRLQVEVAETLAIQMGLTIEAAPPTKPGERANGAVYVLEGENPDLRIRQMGQAGADVALLSERAQEIVKLPGRPPIWWEAKNTEGWRLDAAFWRAHDLPAVALKAIQQAYVACRKDKNDGSRGYLATPVVVLGKNNHEPMALWQAQREEIECLMDHGTITLVGPAWAMCRFDKFVRLLQELRMRGDA